MIWLTHGKYLSGGSMMTESEQILKRQAEWQRSRSSMTWKQKLNLSVIMRNSLNGFTHQIRPTTSITKNRGA